MQAMDFGQNAFQPFRRPFDFRNAGKEGQHIALPFIGKRTADGRSHFIFDPRLGFAADVLQCKRPGFALALNYRRIHQLCKASAIERRRHRHQPQIWPQSALGIER